jgi:hypothetical protein
MYQAFLKALNYLGFKRCEVCHQHKCLYFICLSTLKPMHMNEPLYPKLCLDKYAALQKWSSWNWPFQIIPDVFISSSIPVLNIRNKLAWFVGMLTQHNTSKLVSIPWDIVFSILYHNLLKKCKIFPLFGFVTVD